jgi:hypothetical protein
VIETVSYTQIAISTSTRQSTVRRLTLADKEGKMFGSGLSSPGGFNGRTRRDACNLGQLSLLSFSMGVTLGQKMVHWQT